jgi:hypothetical protein
MHADSDTIEAKDAGLAICSRNAARICCVVLRYMRNSGMQPPLINGMVGPLIEVHSSKELCLDLLCK